MRAGINIGISFEIPDIGTFLNVMSFHDFAVQCNILSCSSFRYNAVGLMFAPLICIYSTILYRKLVILAVII